MSIQRPTDSKGCARLLLTSLYARFGKASRSITALEYGQVASQMGLTSPEMASALRDLKQDLLIVYPNPATATIAITKTGIEKADYLNFRQEFPLVGDPLPDSLENVQAEIRFWAQEKPKHHFKSEEWQIINARVDDLKHLENTMPKRRSNAVSTQNSTSSRSSIAPAMSNWYLGVRKLLREVHARVLHADNAWKAEDKGSAETICGYLKKDYQRLEELWRERLDEPVPSSLGRHIAWGKANDMSDILGRDLPELEETLDGMLVDATEKTGDAGFRHLLHPVIIASSYEQFQNGQLRDAVLNSIVAIFDLIRNRTGIDLDGSALVGKALSLVDPYLVLSELETASGRDDQKGFIQIFSGSYLGIRNPKAHSLAHDLTEIKTSQYLVYASLLARRVSDAEVIKHEPTASHQERAAGGEPTPSRS